MNVNKQTILVVDDKEENRLILNELLKLEYKVKTAKNGKIALKIIKKDLPDLILLDVMMPEMSGFEVCEYLKADMSTSTIPIIFVTANDEDGEEAKGLELGAVDYITKPICPAIVKARIKTHLFLYDQNKVLDQKVKDKTVELATANNRLSNLEKTKSDFLSLISHELKTPLNSLAVIKQIFDKMEIAAEKREILEIAGYSIDRLIRFSEIALLITELHAENFILHDIMPLSIKSLLESSEGELNDLIIKKQIKIITNSYYHSIAVHGNGDLIIKTIKIILDNAIRYSSEKSEVLIKVNENDENIIIEVEDYGPGFSKEAMSKLFDFFSCDDIMHHTEGFGLGLSAAKLIMNIHNGEIEVKNKKKSGAIVKLVFFKY